MRALLLATLLLTACQRGPAGNTASALPSGPAAAASTRSVPAPSAAAVRPGELRVFGDWTVACDNVALCQMASLGAKGAEFPAVTMAVLRQPGPAGAIDLSFATIGDADAVRPVALVIDGRRLPLATLNGADAAAVARMMASGTALTVLEQGDRRRARLSLAGAAAALRWIDAQQGRAGTVTALVARGARGADAVPAARPAPVIHAVAATGAGTPPSAAQLAAMRARADCDPRAGQDVFGPPETHALGHGTTLVMLPCSTGAYNLSSALFVLRDGKVVPALADAPVGFEATPAAGRDRIVSVVNGVWKDGELTSDAKGRGLGDCGVHQTLVWDGSRLRLAEQSEMRECRGNPNYLTTWRAQVVRG